MNGNLPREIDVAFRSNFSDNMPPPQAPFNQAQTSAQENAGILRRNQACLACRRRKLKCDAARPHCSTCIRSHKHLMRTSPRSNPVLTCHYDDAEEEPVLRASSGSIDDDDDDAKKRKRSSNDVRRKKKEADIELEREKLAKRVAELEIALAKKNSGSFPTEPDTRPWGVKPSEPVTAPSPTAFLDMLSSAATSQFDNATSTNGLRSGAQEDAMMSSMLAPSPGAWITNILDPSKNKTINGIYPFDAPQKDLSDITQQSSSGSGSSRPSTEGGLSQSPFNFNSAPSPAGPSVLSPNGIFNFSPGPTGPIQWAAPLPSESKMSAAVSNDGPWRSIETVNTVFEFSTVTDQDRIAAAELKCGLGQGMEGIAPMTFDQPMEFDNVEANAFQINETDQQQLFMDLFWPGWPTNLPEPSIVNELIEGFFDKVPNLPRLLHKGRLQSRMALPPTHSNFPHPGLIHAICAAAASWCPPSVWGGDYGFPPSSKGPAEKDYVGLDKFPQKEEKKLLPFGARQAAFAKDAIQEGLNTGNRLFDVVRAMIILSRVFIDDTRMLECWAYCGLVARMILPLGLNVRSAELSLKSVMLPPPADALEREERRAVLWMALYHDTIASAASGWGTSMSLEELSVPLPVSALDFETGAENMLPNPQDLDSPDIWIKHPVADPFVMVLKATVIMNRVNRFARKWKNRHLRVDDDMDGMKRAEFRELANAIACLQMSFPPILRNPCKMTSKKRLDIDLISAQMLPHAAIICLYEPFADITDPNDAQARRLLNASQAIVSIVQQLASLSTGSSSNFGDIMHSSASVCLVTAARTGLLFYRQALNVNDHETADSLKMDIETIGMALGQFGVKFKIGQHHAQLIEYFLDRATNPTFEKLSAHYPEHPRPGAPELHPNANFGLCVQNALNIKRGYWKLLPQNTAGISPFGSTPDSETNTASNPFSMGHLPPAESRRSSGGIGGGYNNSGGSGSSASVTRVDSDSPSNPPGSSASSVDNPAVFSSAGSGIQVYSNGLALPARNDSERSESSSHPSFTQNPVNQVEPYTNVWTGGQTLPPIPPVVNTAMQDVVTEPSFARWFVNPDETLKEMAGLVGESKANGSGAELASGGVIGGVQSTNAGANLTGMAEANWFMKPDDALKSFKQRFGIDLGAANGV